MIDKILLTGSTGFLGNIILNHLITQSSLDTLGRHKNNDIFFDFREENLQISKSYDLVIHCLGKAHSIPKTVSEKKEFFDVNVRGSQNLLKALEKSPTLPKSFVFISSVAVYGIDSGRDIDENHSLDACDPYGRSKIEAEYIIQEWCATNNVICTILRLPLIAGPNPPGNLGAMVKGINKGYYFDIAGGTARKSVVLAEDVAMVIPKVASIGGIYNLTDRCHPSFSELSLNISRQLGRKQPSNLPMWIAKLIGRIGDFLGKSAPVNTKKLNKITSDLTFNDQNAVKALNWNPKPVLKGLKIN